MEDPSGICLCGCGQQTPVSPRTRGVRGIRKGEHVRYISGHNGRKYQDGYVVTDMGHDTPCWITTGCKNERGYGSVTGGSAHRRYYEAKYGPTRLHLHHLCEVKSCVNPDHLEPLTQGEHNARHARRLTKELAAEIRAATGSHRSLARQFGISKTHIGRVLRGENWG